MTADGAVWSVTSGPAPFGPARRGPPRPVRGSSRPPLPAAVRSSRVGNQESRPVTAASHQLRRGRVGPVRPSPAVDRGPQDRADDRHREQRRGTALVCSRRAASAPTAISTTASARRISRPAPGGHVRAEPDARHRADQQRRRSARAGSRRTAGGRAPPRDQRHRLHQVGADQLPRPGAPGRGAAARR